MRSLFIRNLWLWKCGLPEKSSMDKQKYGSINLKDLAMTEWNNEFEELMRNRLQMGAMRYGKINEPGKPQYDRITSIIKRLRKYSDGGNKEHLVDAANLCLMEFTECNHPSQHFKSIDDGEHTDALI